MTRTWDWFRWGRYGASLGLVIGLATTGFTLINARNAKEPAGSMVIISPVKEPQTSTVHSPVYEMSHTGGHVAVVVPCNSQNTISMMDQDWSLRQVAYDRLTAGDLEGAILMLKDIDDQVSADAIRNYIIQVILGSFKTAPKMPYALEAVPQFTAPPLGDPQAASRNDLPPITPKALGICLDLAKGMQEPSLKAKQLSCLAVVQATQLGDKPGSKVTFELATKSAHESQKRTDNERAERLAKAKAESENAAPKAVLPGDKQATQSLLEQGLNGTAILVVALFIIAEIAKVILKSIGESLRDFFAGLLAKKAVVVAVAPTDQVASPSTNGHAAPETAAATPEAAVTPTPLAERMGSPN